MINGEQIVHSKQNDRPWNPRVEKALLVELGCGNDGLRLFCLKVYPCNKTATRPKKVKAPRRFVSRRAFILI